MKLNKADERVLGEQSQKLGIAKRSIHNFNKNLNTYNTVDKEQAEDGSDVEETLGDGLNFTQKQAWNKLNDRQKQQLIDKASISQGSENVPTFGTFNNEQEILDGASPFAQKVNSQNTSPNINKYLQTAKTSNTVKPTTSTNAINKVKATQPATVQRNQQDKINTYDSYKGYSVGANKSYDKARVYDTGNISNNKFVPTSSNKTSPIKGKTYNSINTKKVEPSISIQNKSIGSMKLNSGGTVVSAGANLGRGITSTLQRGIETKSTSLAQNLQQKSTPITSSSSMKEVGTYIAVKGAIALVHIMASLFTAILAALLPIIIAITVVATIIIVIIAIASIFTSSEGSAGNTLVEVAKYQLESQSAVIGGYRYKNWYGMDDNWCAMFVSYCANEAGYIDEGVIPLTASVSVQQQWFIDNDLYETKESGYKPKAGDIIIFKNGISHTGIVIEYDSETDRVITIEGNTGGSITAPYHIGSSVLECSYSRLASTISGYGTPLYPEAIEGAGPLPLTEGTKITLPENLGKSHTYMGWQTITSASSQQFQLRKDSGMNFDEEGFAIIGERYVIACTSTFGEVGDYIDWYQEDGTTIKSIIGDIKDQTDEGCTEWGHNNGEVVVEFIVDKDSWYGTGHANPGTSSCHPEWNQYITKAINRGNYWRE